VGCNEKRKWYILLKEKIMIATLKASTIATLKASTSIIQRFVSYMLTAPIDIFKFNKKQNTLEDKIKEAARLNSNELALEACIEISSLWKERWWYFWAWIVDVTIFLIILFFVLKILFPIDLS
jgi:hypothetical protein